MSWLRRIDATGVPLLLARLVLGGMMIRMGWSKIGDPVAFLQLLGQYEMFPAGWYVVENLIAVCLPWIELIGGAALIAGLFTRGNALLFLVLLFAFTVVIIGRAMDIHATQGIPYGQIHFDCGCGGGDVYFKTKAPENVGLWLLSWVCLLSCSRRFTLDGLLFARANAAPRERVDVPPSAAVEHK
jgi:uncharacterized membrane protein YphA (DoxX/SURF4 family)